MLAPLKYCRNYRKLHGGLVLWYGLLWTKCYACLPCGDASSGLCHHFGQLSHELRKTQLTKGQGEPCFANLKFVQKPHMKLNIGCDPLVIAK